MLIPVTDARGEESLKEYVEARGLDTIIGSAGYLKAEAYEEYVAWSDAHDKDCYTKLGFVQRLCGCYGLRMDSKRVNGREWCSIGE